MEAKKFTVEVTALPRGHKVSFTGDVQTECYCAKLREVPQAVKEVLLLAFPKGGRK